MTETKRKLCGKHGEERMEWLTARQPAGPVMLVGQAAADFTARGIQERQRNRAEAWRQTCRDQAELIERICAGERNCGPSTPERVLAVEVSRDGVTAQTVREFLSAVLLKLLHQGDAFSPYFGPYGERWDDLVTEALEVSGQFGLAQLNDMERWQKGRRLLDDAIRLLGKTPA